MFSYIKKKPYLFLFTAILLIGLFFRSYHVLKWLNFDHDSELFSWIVKDIVVNHHFRLIGQLTTAPGIFIGPLYYYCLVPFFLLFNMDPIGSVIPIIILGMLTIASYYFVFSKLFNKNVGLVGSFIYAVSIQTVELDRRVVPSTPTGIWVIWYLYTVFMLARGNFKVLPILGILIGLIWHVHIALAPTLIAVPIAFFIAKRIPSKKQMGIFLLITIISSLPLIIFESRHQFVQSKSFIKNLTANFGNGGQISEQREIILGKENENAKLNLNESSKFILEVEPKTPLPNQLVNLKITTKNPKYSTLIVQTDCGNPTRFEIGNINGNFNWTTNGCKEGPHVISASARIPVDPFWKITLGKFVNVYEKENRNINNLFFSPLELPIKLQLIITFIFLLLPLIAWVIGAFNLKDLYILYSWIFAVFLFFTFSSISVSEYYLASIDAILILSSSLILFRLYRYKKLAKYLILLLLVLYAAKNLSFYLNYKYYNKGYNEKKSLVDFISEDVKKRNLPCIAVNYITTPGENTGFRYFMYLKKLYVVNSKAGIPVYNIVIPEELTSDPNKIKFGHVGLIPPSEIPAKEVMEKSCTGPNTNLTDSLFGYVE